MKRISRRTFIVSAAGLSTALVLGYKWPALVGPDRAKQLQQLAQIIDTYSSSHKLGEAYLKSVPQENDVHQLLDLIVGSLPPGESAAEALRSKLKQEYSSAELVSLDGWLLAQTEARLYALSFLTRVSNK